MMNSDPLSASVTPILMISACQDWLLRPSTSNRIGTTLRKQSFDDGSLSVEETFIPDDASECSEQVYVKHLFVCGHPSPIHVEVAGDGDLRVWVTEE